MASRVSIRQFTFNLPTETSASRDLFDYQVNAQVNEWIDANIPLGTDAQVTGHATGEHWIVTVKYWKVFSN